MSQYDRDISGQTSGTQLIDDFNLSMSAIHSGHIGPTRPPYAERGMTWTREGSPEQLMYFDGTSDIALFNLDESIAAQVGTPVGGIIMWHGLATAIPAGWVLCNGQNGTPDLRGRFIVGAGGEYAPLAVGGANTVTLSVANLPSHNHGAGTLKAANETEVHKHTAICLATGKHKHGANNSGDTRGWQQAIDNPDGDAYNGDARLLRRGLNPFSTTEDGDHSHEVRISGGEHSHPVEGSTSTTGSGKPFNALPPYYALCYIMKV